MHVSGAIYFKRKDFSYEQLEEIRLMLRVKNPEYLQKSRFANRFSKKDMPNQWLHFLEKSPKKATSREEEEFRIPRNYFITKGDVLYIDKTTTNNSSNLLFAGSLRDYQEKFFIEEPSVLEETDKILVVPCGHGKCFDPDQEALMYDLSTKKHRDIEVGDLLMGQDSTPRKVLGKHSGSMPMYEIRQNKGITYKVNENHILSLVGRGEYSKDGVVNISVKEYLNKSKNWKNNHLGYKAVLDFPKQDTPIEPYFFGAWLGDGDTRNPIITVHKDEKPLINAIKDFAKRKGFLISVSYDKRNENVHRYSITSTTTVNPLRNEIKRIGKRIPTEYLKNDRATRLELLAGLIDTDGSYYNKNLEWTQKESPLVDDFKLLCNSLGFSTRDTVKKVKGKNYHRIHISGDIHEIPCKLERKKPEERKINKNPLVNSIEVVPIGEGDYVGVAVDGDHLYCLPDCTVVHNTVMALYMTSFYQQRTLVLVPTNYLKEQWYSSAKKFLPKADVRRADSTKKLDWENADVYIITLDLLNSRYEDLHSQGFFNYWGHTILDEAHTLGAQTYHPFLTELNGKYRTALSATFRRNDGMHVILAHHFGDQYEMPLQFDKAELYQVNTDVFVGAIAKLNATQIRHMKDMCDDVESPYDVVEDIFHFHDVGNIESYLKVAEKEPTFTKTKKAALKSSLKKLLGSTKKPNYPLFDSYIASEADRYRKTVSLLNKLAGNKRCVLVLSKRKEVLKKLNKSLEKKGIKTQLIISETNVKGLAESSYVQEEAQVILGINQLAKEGMDIERLDTLVLLHPIKDTEQAIGRILRYREGKPTPKVYYLCDKSQISTGIFTAGLRYIGNNANFISSVKMKELITELDEKAG